MTPTNRQTQAVLLRLRCWQQRGTLASSCHGNSAKDTVDVSHLVVGSGVKNTVKNLRRMLLNFNGFLTVNLDTIISA